MILQQAPIFRYYRLGVRAADRERFVQAGQANLTTSIREEPGTLAMTAAHVNASETDNVVVELYRDAAAYAVHAASPQFSQYGQVAQQILTTRQMTELVPRFIRIQPRPLEQVSTMILLEVTVTRPAIGAVLRTQLRRLAAGPGAGSFVLAGSHQTDDQQWTVLLPQAPVVDQLIQWVTAQQLTYTQQLLGVDTAVAQGDVGYEE